MEKTHPVTLEYIERNHIMMMGTDAGYVDLFDFIPGMPGESLDDLFASSVEAGGGRFASLEWLKRLKATSGRPQDLIDLENLP